MKKTPEYQYNQLWHPQIENSSKVRTILLKNYLIPDPYFAIFDQRNALILRNLEPLTIGYPLDFNNDKISKETIEIVSLVTQMALEMNSNIYYNADALEKCQIFLHINTLWL